MFPAAAAHFPDHKMAQHIDRLHQILAAKEQIRAHALHLSRHLMHEHVRPSSAAAASSPRHNPGGEYRRHPPRRIWRVPGRPVDHDHVPPDVVHVVREVVHRQLAVGVEQVLHRPALSVYLSLEVLDQTAKVSDFGGEPDVVGLGRRVPLLEP